MDAYLASAGDNLKTDLLDLATALDNNSNTMIKTYYVDISPKSGSIHSISVANPTIITSFAHGLETGRIIDITGSNSTPTINSEYPVFVIDDNNFSIPALVTSPGNSGSWSTVETSFLDLLASFNTTITNLNSDDGLEFHNYVSVTNDTNLEAVVTAVDPVTKLITLNMALDFIVGESIVFESIDCTFTYCPITLGDSLNIKQMFESTMMFSNKAFTSATLSFASDLQPSFTPIPFFGDGNGLFGTNQFGNGYFGGSSNGAPFRTYIPRNAQRCRYIIPMFEHNIAREEFAIQGLTLTGNVAESSRGYR